MSTFIAGALLRIGTDPDGFQDESSETSVDPNVVQLKISVGGIALAVSQYAAGVQTGPYEIVRDALGHYHANVDSTGMVGTWIVEWVSDPDGTPVQLCQAISAARFTVIASPV